MILILDNYDSFVFNLSRYCEELGETIAVYRNDALSIDDIARLNPDAILLSPGPGRPEDAGIMIELIKAFSGTIPILGICLGHQAIGSAFGARVTRALEPMHGRASLINHTQSALFENIASPLSVGRYHSLIISSETMPNSLKPTAHSERGEIMALEHVSHPTFGMQFHPESILTDCGHQLIRNFLEITHAKARS
ncbi:anthranilate synthase component II [Cohaesibacter celericrescens]|uniref:Aminodeoxychorismate/anthranilate synthase component II n=1 Tax=Cohaesibacter celericrescens TaxID=2067669 RepID=A0A2N5XS69_9HYPH|nr:aminodeoxychorismate/anthranilate synthase component II [Cohaesibacter celericrescens]PLW77371.1 aminodeoxychorismate/anthranilate synthase component II [Cohaesibacter celericrescens]